MSLIELDLVEVYIFVGWYVFKLSFVFLNESLIAPKSFVEGVSLNESSFDRVCFTASSIALYILNGFSNLTSSFLGCTLISTSSGLINMLITKSTFCPWGIYLEYPSYIPLAIPLSYIGLLFTNMYVFDVFDLWYEGCATYPDIFIPEPS